MLAAGKDGKGSVSGRVQTAAVASACQDRSEVGRTCDDFAKRKALQSLEAREGGGVPGSALV